MTGDEKEQSEIEIGRKEKNEKETRKTERKEKDRNITLTSRP